MNIKKQRTSFSKDKDHKNHKGHKDNHQDRNDDRDKDKDKNGSRNRDQYKELIVNDDLLKNSLQVHKSLAINFCKLPKTRLERMASDERRPSTDPLVRLAKGHARDIQHMWQGFTEERGQLNRYLMDPKRGAASYLLGIHPLNLARSHHAWQRLVERLPSLKDYLAAREEIQIVDFGCGSGALTHSLLHTLKSLGVKRGVVKVEGFDRIGRYLDMFREGASHLLAPEQIRTHKIELAELEISRLDRSLTPSSPRSLRIICLGYVWNEIQKNPIALQKFRRLLHGLSASPNDTLIWVMEPANQTPARQLMELRDELVEAGAAPLYPCLKKDPCPMLQRDKDWCYSEFSWQKPAYIKYLDERMGLNRSRLASACLILASPSLYEALTPAQGESTTTSKVIVGRPKIQQKGRPRPGARTYQYLWCDGEQLGNAKPSPETTHKGLRGSLM